MESTLLTIRPGRQVCVHRIAGAGDHETTSRLTCFFFHGLGGRIQQLESAMAAAAASPNVRACIGLDMVGHGESPMPPDHDMVGDKNPYCFEHIIEDMLVMVQREFAATTAAADGATHPPRPCVFVGHSYGTMIALTTADRLLNAKPQELLPNIVVHSIMLIGATDVMDTSSSWMLRMVPTTVLGWLRPLARNGFNAKAYDVSTSPEIVARENAQSDKNSMVTIKGLVLGMQWSFPASIASIGCPVCLVSGESDGITPVVGARRLLAGGALGTKAELHVIPHASHNVMVEKPDEVNKLLLPLLEVERP